MTWKHHPKCDDCMFTHTQREVEEQYQRGWDEGRAALLGELCLGDDKQPLAISQRFQFRLWDVLWGIRRGIKDRMVEGARLKRVAQLTYDVEIPARNVEERRVARAVLDEIIDYVRSTSGSAAIIG